MLYAFIDESYTRSMYYQAALVISDFNLPKLVELKSEVLHYVSGFGVGLDTELHAHSLMSGTDGWEIIANQPRAKITIFERIHSLIAQLPVDVFIEGVDVDRLNVRYAYPQSPHTVTLRHLSERLQTHAEAIGDSVAVICDETGDEHVHHRDFAFYQNASTQGYKPSNLANLSTLEFARSHDHVGLQIVDQIVYLYRRLDSHVETNPKTATAVERIWRSTKAVVRTHRRWDP